MLSWKMMQSLIFSASHFYVFCHIILEICKSSIFFQPDRYYLGNKQKSSPCYFSKNRDKGNVHVVVFCTSRTRKYALPLASLWTKLWRLSPDNFPKASLGHLNWIFLLEVFTLQQISCPSGDKVTCVKGSQSGI